MPICLTTGSQLDANLEGAWAGPDRHVCRRRRADIPPAAPRTETIRCGSLKGQLASSENPTGYASPVKTETNSRPPWTKSRGPIS